MGPCLKVCCNGVLFVIHVSSRLAAQPLLARTWTGYSRLHKVGQWPRTMYAGVPSSLGLGVGGQSYSNFLSSTVKGVAE